VQQARKVDIPLQKIVAPPEPSVWDRGARWPLHLRFLFLIATATACWGALLLLVYWLIF